MSATFTNNLPSFNNNQPTQGVVPMQQQAQPMTHNVVAQPLTQPAVEMKMLVHRNLVDTKGSYKNADGKKMPLYLKDKDGLFQQRQVDLEDVCDPSTGEVLVEQETVQLNDQITVLGFNQLIMTNPAMAMQKLADLRTYIESKSFDNDKTYAPSSKAVAHPMLNNTRVHITPKGNLVGWVCKKSSTLRTSTF